MRRIISLAMLVAIVTALLAMPAAAQPQPVDRVQRDGVWYTVYEEQKPGDPNLYRYYVEDGALGGSNKTLRLYRRTSGMESAAVIAVTLLFSASILAVARRRSVLDLLGH